MVPTFTLPTTIIYSTFQTFKKPSTKHIRQQSRELDQICTPLWRFDQPTSSIWWWIRTHTLDLWSTTQITPETSGTQPGWDSCQLTSRRYSWKQIYLWEVRSSSAFFLYLLWNHKWVGVLESRVCSFLVTFIISLFVKHTQL